MSAADIRNRRLRATGRPTAGTSYRVDLGCDWSDRRAVSVQVARVGASSRGTQPDATLALPVAGEMNARRPAPSTEARAVIGRGQGQRQSDSVRAVPSLAQQNKAPGSALKRRAPGQSDRRPLPAVDAPVAKHPDQSRAPGRARADVVPRPTPDAQVMAGEGRDPVPWRMELPGSIHTMPTEPHKPAAPRRVARRRAPELSPLPASIPAKVVDGRAAIASRPTNPYLDTRDATMEMLRRREHKHVLEGRMPIYAGPAPSEGQHNVSSVFEQHRSVSTVSSRVVIQQALGPAGASPRDRADYLALQERMSIDRGFDAWVRCHRRVGRDNHCHRQTCTTSP